MPTDHPIGKEGPGASPTPREGSAAVPHYHGHRQRLRDRFLQHGLESLPDYEAVELLLTLAIPRRDVKAEAKALVARFGSFRGVFDASLEELQTVDGIGEATAVALKIMREAANRYLQQRTQATFSLSNWDDLFSYCRSQLGPLRNEAFRVFFLDTARHIIGDETLEEGTVDRAAIYPRRVMDAALRRGAAALVFAHNHPNGNPTPSEQDKTITRALVLAARALQVEVIDHVIVSQDEVFSFAQEGLL